MSTNTRTIDATPQQVWDVLADGWLYPLWVVGASRMREVDDGWPAVGTQLHHSVGSWPVLIDDTTEVLEASAGSTLVLRARAWPVGEAEVTIRLRAVGRRRPRSSSRRTPSPDRDGWCPSRCATSRCPGATSRRCAGSATSPSDDHEQMTTYDAVVVGAGPNGLVAANHLIDQGWSVLVLEAQDTLGGAVRSARDVHPDYVHDTFSAFYPLAAASPTIRAFDLESHGLVWSHAPAVLGHPLPDGDWALLHRDRDVTAGLMDAAHAGDGEAWLALCAPVGRDRRRSSSGRC